MIGLERLQCYVLLCPEGLGCFGIINIIMNIGEIHYHKENKTNGSKQIEFSAESNQFEKKIKSGNK